ncbi:leucine-rich repeat receptor protein kinase HPCA1-like [Silene latifolia]|uniref:leucine-rich repeat receptor protein kinase HPCA1-like n=1 Tax=Silene latifolia TaxID=37657 RepID=UPI003D772528
MSLSSLGLKGMLSGDIQGLSELQILDLSYNKGLTGDLPAAIGKLRNLTNLILIGCRFSGYLDKAVGSLSELVFLSLNGNRFSGSIPNSLGNLSKLNWLDLTYNMFSGTIPVSNGTTPGLDLLVNTKHFHFGRNQLSGEIPPQLFNENMTLIHLLLDNNQFTGSIPSTLGLVQSLEFVRLDGNSLTGSLPTNISNLTKVSDMSLSNNQLTGLIPDLTGMNHLNNLDMSNNTFEASDFPSWITELPSLSALTMERTQLQGIIPATLFSLPQLKEVKLKNNRLSGSLDLREVHGSQLQLIDLENNNISEITLGPQGANFRIILVKNQICEESVQLPSYCIIPQPNPRYSTPSTCPSVACNSTEIASPNCQCGYPYTGTLEFRAPQFFNLQNPTYYTLLEQKLMDTFHSCKTPVDSVSLSNISRTSLNYLDMHLEIFPLGQVRFNRTGILNIAFILSNQTFKPPKEYGPFAFSADDYSTFADAPGPGPVNGSKKSLSVAAVVAISVGCSAFLLVLLCIGAIIFYQKRRPNKTVDPTNTSGFMSSSFWTYPGSTASTLQLSGSRMFSFEDLKKITNNFLEANCIGSGTYGKVYRGTLPNGQLVAVKRAKQGSTQAGLGSKNEIELLSRLHHKNLVSLLGFCLEKDELILVYEFVPNGTLKGSLSGKSGISLDWRRRIKVALGTARGLAYLHELANPPIIHRDIKPNNILLDQNLNAKVSDFGLSKPVIDDGKGHMMTEVKGTMGYLDPEYYMTQKLSEKSDIYSFGVLMLELVTGKPPIEKGRYIVREVTNVMDRAKDLYGLHEFLDPAVGPDVALKGFEKYVDLALRCVEESGDDRPVMSEVVKQIEEISEMAGLHPYSDSATSSATFDRRYSRKLYGDESLYSHTAALSLRE